MLDNLKPKFKLGDFIGRISDLPREKQVVDHCEGEYKILYCATGRAVWLSKGWVEENFVLFEKQDYLFEETM